MKQFIEFNGVQIEQGLCTVAFRVQYNHMLQTQETTHNTVYKLIQGACKVEPINDGHTKKFARLTFKDVLTVEIYHIG